MTSKLFHAVVGVGISLGAMSVGCSAAVDKTDGDDAVAQASSEMVASTEAKASQAKDRFCEVAWPTTKGGPRPERAQTCIDPNHACGAYPGQLFNYEFCQYADHCTKVCDFERPEIWMFCKETKTSHAWACPKGTIPRSTCAEPAAAAP